MTWTAAVAMMRDEADVAEGWARHLAGQVDLILVADNSSTDGTAGILADLAKELRLVVVPDPEVGYFQSAKMSGLAGLAAGLLGSAEVWIVPADADELWNGDGGPIREVLAEVVAPVAVARLTNHFRTAYDDYDQDPFRRMTWREPEPQALVKVAFRWEPGAVIHQGNHNVTLPSDQEPVAELTALTIRHFPVRSAAHMIRKARNGAAAYAAAPDLPEDWGGHWRSWGAMTDDQLREAFHAHWWYPTPTGAGLVRDPAPYQQYTPGR